MSSRSGSDQLGLHRPDRPPTATSSQFFRKLFAGCQTAALRLSFAAASATVEQSMAGSVASPALRALCPALIHKQSPLAFMVSGTVGAYRSQDQTRLVQCADGDSWRERHGKASSTAVDTMGTHRQMASAP